MTGCSWYLPFLNVFYNIRRCFENYLAWSDFCIDIQYINRLGIFTIIIGKQQTLYISVIELYGKWCKILFRLYTIYFAKTNGIWMPTVIMVVKVKDNQPVKASGKHCWLRHVGYWLLFDLIYLSNSMILQHLHKGTLIECISIEIRIVVLKTYIYSSYV